MIRVIGGQVVLIGRLLTRGRRTPLSGRAILTQVAALGVATAPLVVSGLAFFGVVIVTIAWAQARKYIGNVALVGPAYFELIVREFAPLLTALLAASQQAATISAELGAMAANEQIEALELSAADPLAELVVPRVLASIIALPLLNAVGTVAATGAAVATISLEFGGDGWAFANAQLIDTADVVCALAKSLLVGAYIPVAASWRGMAARQGAGAVGEAVTTAVVEACMGCLLLDFGVAAVFLSIT